MDYSASGKSRTQPPRSLCVRHLLAFVREPPQEREQPDDLAVTFGPQLPVDVPHVGRMPSTPASAARLARRVAEIDLVRATPARLAALPAVLVLD